MQITDVRVRKVTKEGKMRAVVSITIDDVFVVHDIKVIEGEKGLFIAMPSRKASDGEYRDIAHPINSETRQQVIRRLQVSIQIRYQLPEIHVNAFFAAGSLCFRTVVMHNFHFCGVIGVLCFKCKNIHAIPEILIPYVLNILGHFQENSGCALRVGKIGNHLTHGSLEFNLRIHGLF